MVSNKNLKKVLTTRNPKSSFSTALFNIKVLVPLWLAGAKTGLNGFKRESSQRYMSKRASCSRRRTARYSSIKISLRLEEIFSTVHNDQTGRTSFFQENSISPLLLIPSDRNPSTVKDRRCVSFTR